MTSRELEKIPLVGKRVKISRVTGGTYLGLSGEVLEDRENVLVIDDQGRKKLIPKKVCTFEIFDNGRLLGEINGQTLIGRPEDRCN